LRRVSTRLIKLADARLQPFSKWKSAKLAAVQSVHRTRDAACLDRSSMKIVPHFGRRCDAVRALVRISLEIEQLFPAAVRHEDVFPFIRMGVCTFDSQTANKLDYFLF
jgi:hypothetical protein